MSNFDTSTINPITKQAVQAVQNEYLDVSQLKLPKTKNEVFNLAKYYNFTDPLVKNIIEKSAGYPITNPIISDPNKNIQKLWKDLFKTLKIKTTLFEIGMDYQGYNNAIVSINIPFIKNVECDKCHTKIPVKDIKDNDIHKLEKKKLKYKCPGCGKVVYGKLSDDFLVNNYNQYTITKWAPQDVDILHFPIVGKSEYFYVLPKKLITALTTTSKFTLKLHLVNTPQPFIEAAVANDTSDIARVLNKKNQTVVRLDPEKLYHFKKPSVSGFMEGWGIPSVLSIAKVLYLLQTLRKAQEAIAKSNMVPNRYLYVENVPMGQGNDLYSTINVKQWLQTVKGEVKKWKNDPNHIALLPLPLGQGMFGGQGKNLLLYNEIKVLEDEIVVGMGVPREFPFGGLSYNGSSVSLRMLENQFITYRDDLDDFLEFLVNRIAILANIKPPKTVKLSNFKMWDDVQQKNLIMQLGQGGWVSRKTVLNNVAEIDYDKEIELLKKEQVTTSEISLLQQVLGVYTNQQLQEKQAMLGRLFANKQSAWDYVQQNPVAASSFPTSNIPTVSLDSVIQTLRTTPEKARPSIIDQLVKQGIDENIIKQALTIIKHEKDINLSVNPVRNNPEQRASRSNSPTI